MFPRILFLFLSFLSSQPFVQPAKKCIRQNETRKGKINFTGVKSNDRDMKLGEFHSLVSYNNSLPLTFLSLLVSLSLFLPLFLCFYLFFHLAESYRFIYTFIVEYLLATVNSSWYVYDTKNARGGTPLGPRQDIV